MKLIKPFLAATLAIGALVSPELSVAQSGAELQALFKQSPDEGATSLYATFNATRAQFADAYRKAGRQDLVDKANKLQAVDAVDYVLDDTRKNRDHSVERATHDWIRHQIFPDAQPST